MGVWLLELARWLGMLFWAWAMLTLLIRRFRESHLRLLFKVFARDHVIIAGLGQNDARLVESLLRKQRSVVVIESNRDHPTVNQCRRMGPSFC
jgi:hypothetical protein